MCVGRIVSICLVSAVKKVSLREGKVLSPRREVFVSAKGNIFLRGDE
jgi:hypothetical protein